MALSTIALLKAKLSRLVLQRKRRYTELGYVKE